MIKYRYTYSKGNGTQTYVLIPGTISDPDNFENLTVTFYIPSRTEFAVGIKIDMLDVKKVLINSYGIIDDNKRRLGIKEYLV